MTITLPRLLLLLVFLLPLSIHARDNYSIINYTTDDGLPQNSITGIQFDRKGYCWLGTEMGVVRFDGNQFKVFGVDEIKGLKSERIRGVTSSHDGKVFIQTGGIIQYLWIEDTSSLATSRPVLNEYGSLLPGLSGYQTPSLSRTKNSYTDHSMVLNSISGNKYILEPDSICYVSNTKRVSGAAAQGPPVHAFFLFDEILINIRACLKFVQ